MSLQQARALLVGAQHGRWVRDQTGHQPFPSARQVLPWAGLAPWRGRGRGWGWGELEWGPFAWPFVQEAAEAMPGSWGQGSLRPVRAAASGLL